jgi:hypothetical protein
MQGDAVITLADFLADKEVEEEALPGVFAIYDERRAVQYIGHDANVYARIQVQSYTCPV